jgi:hypothetical protein
MGFQKKLWWSLLVAGLGTVGIFVIITFIDPFPPPLKILSIPLFGFVLSSLAVWRLRLCYKAEPIPADARWHFSIQDLLALTFFEGLLLSVFQATIPELFFKLGIPFALLLAAACVPGALMASYKRIKNPIARAVYACGFAMMLIGGILSGGLAVILAMLPVLGGDNPMEVLHEIVIEIPVSPDSWINMMFRIGMILLIAGFVACGLAGRDRAETSAEAR